MNMRTLCIEAKLKQRGTGNWIPTNEQRGIWDCFGTQMSQMFRWKLFVIIWIWKWMKSICQRNHRCNSTKSPLVKRDPFARSLGEKLRETSMAQHRHLSCPLKGILPCVRRLCKLKVAKILNMLTGILVRLPNLIRHWEYLSALTGMDLRQVSLTGEYVLFWTIGDMQFKKKKMHWESVWTWGRRIYPQHFFFFFFLTTTDIQAQP